MSGFIIFSAAKSELTNAENTKRYKTVIQGLKDVGIEYANIDGVYKGETELSLRVDLKHIEVINELCLILDQECYLVVKGDRSSYLVDPITRKTTKLDGRYQKITYKEAQNMENFSRCPIDNQYYAVV